jgi:hypothetical protein
VWRFGSHRQCDERARWSPVELGRLASPSRTSSRCSPLPWYPGSELLRTSFPEAKLVWSCAEPDWRAAISAIVADPSAARHHRLTDALPVRTEQLYCSNPTDLEQIVNLKDSHVLDWVWVPVDAIDVRPQTWSHEARKFAEFVGRPRGRETQDVMQFVIQHLEHHDNYVTWHQNRLSAETSFRIGRAQVFVGRPALQARFLKQDLMLQPGHCSTSLSTRS